MYPSETIYLNIQKQFNNQNGVLYTIPFFYCKNNQVKELKDYFKSKVDNKTLKKIIKYLKTFDINLLKELQPILCKYYGFI